MKACACCPPRRRCERAAEGPSGRDRLGRAADRSAQHQPRRAVQPHLAAGADLQPHGRRRAGRRAGTAAARHRRHDGRLRPGVRHRRRGRWRWPRRECARAHQDGRAFRAPARHPAGAGGAAARVVRVGRLPGPGHDGKRQHRPRLLRRPGRAAARQGGRQHQGPGPALDLHTRPWRPGRWRRRATCTQRCRRRPCRPAGRRARHTGPGVGGGPHRPSHARREPGPTGSAGGF